MANGKPRLEQNLGTVVACAPALRQLLTRRKANSRPSKGSSGKKSSGKNTPGQSNSGNKRAFGSAFDRFKALGGSSGKTTNVSDQTTTTDAGTLIPMVDLEPRRVGKPAEQSRTRTPDTRPTSDIEFQRISPGDDSERSNSERSSSDRSLIRRPELEEIDLGEPFSELSVGRRDSQMLGNRGSDKEPVMRSPPTPRVEARDAPKSRESRAAAQAPMIDVPEDQESIGELPATERSSEEFVADRGVSIPMMDDFFTPWTGPGRGSAALADASPLEYANASNVNRLPAPPPAAVQPPATIQPPVRHLEPSAPHIRISRPQERGSPADEAPHDNRIRFGSTSGRLQQYASSAASSRSQLTASRRPSNADVDKPLPPLPGQSRPSRYQQTWV